MIQIGIFAKTFARPTLEQTLDAVAAHRIATVQLNLDCAGVPSLPERIDPALCAHIRGALAERGLTMAAVSGTYNMLDPDLAMRRDGLARLNELTRACPGMGASVITLCSGTRDPDNLWRRHPANDAPEAWADLVAALADALPVAEAHGVTLAVEPEVANVIDSARLARRLLDEMRSPRLKVVMDAANIFHAGELPQLRAVLDEAFDLLGPDIVVAHAKDLDHDGAAGHLPAGQGVLDYDRYLSLLHAAGFNGPLILHGLAEPEVEACLAFLRGKIAQSPYADPSGGTC